MKQLLATSSLKDDYYKGNPLALKFSESPASIVNSLVANAVIVAGLIFLFMIMFAGFKMVVGAGKGQSAQDAAKAKAALTWSVAGFLLVVMAYFILEIFSAMFGFTFTLALPL